MNKRFRILFYLTLCMALLLATTQALASPLDQQGKDTPTPKVPGAQATQKAIEKGLKQLDKPGKGKHVNFKGIVDAVNADSITLTLRDGSTVTVSLNSDTRIKFPGSKDSTLADIQPGMNAMVQAIRDQSDNLVARSVMVIPGKPVKVHRVGVVTAYSPGESVAIQDKNGNTFTFSLNEDTKLLPAARAGTLAVGSRVTVIAPRNPANDGTVAKGIVIHPAVP